MRVGAAPATYTRGSTAGLEKPRLQDGDVGAVTGHALRRGGIWQFAIDVGQVSRASTPDTGDPRTSWHQFRDGSGQAQHIGVKNSVLPQNHFLEIERSGDAANPEIYVSLRDGTPRPRERATIPPGPVATIQARHQDLLMRGFDVTTLAPGQALSASATQYLLDLVYSVR